jgi:hypothetical protein
VNDIDNLPRLSRIPIPQVAWYLQNEHRFREGKRIIDNMTTLQISKMYEEKKFLCDICGKGLGKSDYSLQDHILHLINPMILWYCEDCVQKDLRNGRIIAWAKESEVHQWQIMNK